MKRGTFTLPKLLDHSPVRVEFGPSKLDSLGALVRNEGARRVLLVTDPGIRAAGHPQRALDTLRSADIDVIVFDGVEENPTTRHVAAGVDVARNGHSMDGAAGIDLIVGLGGGSSMDCAKAINLILTNGGEVADYWGVDKPHEPLLPMIAVPTTAGTGSEAQSFALITDPATHQKMACGDRRTPGDGGLRPRVAILDPDLTRTQPHRVAVMAGIDAVAHAVETAATTKRNELSRRASRDAWELLRGAFETATRDPNDESARADMLLGAHLAGFAIEQSMLGAAHACANPLTARFGVTHGLAVGVMLPSVVRFNTKDRMHNPYSTLCEDPEQLAQEIEGLLRAGGLPTSLADIEGVDDDLSALAEMASKQWTAQFNPYPVGAKELLTIYKSALSRGL